MEPVMTRPVNEQRSSIEPKRFRIRIFRDDEVTTVEYRNVTHIFWTNKGTVLTICLPDENRHAHWLREQVCHYDITEED